MATPTTKGGNNNKDNNNKDNNNKALSTSTSKRPLQKLCRTASKRFFASFHTNSKPTPATELVDSSTTVSLTDCGDADVDDDDDDSSVCSFENGSVTKSVHFARDMAQTRQVENCFYMQPQDRAATWYSRYEINEAKKQQKLVLAILKKKSHQDLKDSVVEAFSGVQLLADSGFDDDDLMQFEGLGNGTSVNERLTHWCSQDINGHACRGLEKHVLKRMREVESRVARSAVLHALKGDSDAATADRYRNLSRYAAIYAESIARADAAAACEI